MLIHAPLLCSRRYWRVHRLGQPGCTHCGPNYGRMHRLQADDLANRVSSPPWTCAAMSSAAPQMPAGRRPVWIQSRFMDLISCSAVALTRCILFRKSSRAAKRCTYRLGSIGLSYKHQLIAVCFVAGREAEHMLRLYPRGPTATRATCRHAWMPLTLVPGQDGILLHAEQLDQLLEHVAQLENVDLRNYNATKDSLSWSGR